MPKKISPVKNKQERDTILESIRLHYPDKKIELNFETPFQLLVAVILSAQMTDKGVNKATLSLFKIVKKPHDLILLPKEEVELMLRSVNYFRNKTRFIYGAANALISDYDSVIPNNLIEMRKLPGVGIKTAKVVLSHLYNTPYIGVDTHIHRVMNRMNIVKTNTPEETDKQLEKILTDEQKRTMHHALVLFGRYVCTARNCRCSETTLNGWCQCQKCSKIKEKVANNGL